MAKKHIVTPEEITANPVLAANGVVAGDEIEITDDTNPNAGDTPELNPIDPAVTPPLPVPTPIKAPPLTPQQKAAEIFAVMPHINTIWFDFAGAWRFYATPGATAIERPSAPAEVNTAEL